METSAAVGCGFRCGFVGLLHLEVIQERLAREFNLELIATAPAMIYKITLTNGSKLEIHNPVDMPDPLRVKEMEDPGIRATIMTPDEYVGSVFKLSHDRRGAKIERSYVANTAMLRYGLPRNAAED